MPIYEYQCQSCGHEHEALVRGGKEPSSCPACEAGGLRRKISRAGVIFKGSGFYINDSRSSSGSAKANGSSSSSSESSSTSSFEASTTPASKSESSSSASSSKTSD